jgi:hypothetical protein
MTQQAKQAQDRYTLRAAYMLVQDDLRRALVKFPEGSPPPPSAPLCVALRVIGARLDEDS